MQPKELLQQTQSPQVAFHRFILLHRKHKTDLFCFFEGSDSQYYFPRINNYNENNHTIVCGNKKSVLESYEIIKKKYPIYKTVFFIDSDFDDPIQKKDLYVTFGYSIENFYCTVDVLSRILKNEFFLKISDKEYLDAINTFNKRQQEFHDATSLFNLWYYSAKLKARNNSTIVKACLNDIFIKEFIQFKFDSITWNYTLNDIKIKFPEAIDISEEDLNANRTDFYSKDPVFRFRGKYQFEFMLKFINYLINDANNAKTILKKKTKFKIDTAIALSQLSQYAETTKCLKDFLNICA
ncbi:MULTISPECIES: DUF4435 domain-containing protein [Sphingobacterium]|uniref:DUF4435 domain-containing protein n=1 Tax=Sphingobacterium TaxID=28453 RepID=UPI001053493B|nr:MULTISPECIES: DUF4435 domain-containing protein [Sphingobacterium]MCW2259613.1 hypothetical protein [Sphingobacterium kitahiroshimense]TCR13944.1 uncharacterized protein DUF4435 [Sphingobacterium sp. JUb78]